MRTIKFLITLILGIGFVICIGHLTEQQTAAQANHQSLTTNDSLPSIEDFQRRLNELEPENPIECDGRLGPATQAKWERIYINQIVTGVFASSSKNVARD